MALGSSLIVYVPDSFVLSMTSIKIPKGMKIKLAQFHHIVHQTGVFEGKADVWDSQLDDDSAFQSVEKA